MTIGPATWSARRLAAGVAALGLAVSLASCGGSGHAYPSSPARHTLPAGSGVASAALPRSSAHRLPAPARIVRTVRVGGFLDGLAYAGGRLWAADLDGGRVVEVDPGSGRVVRSVPAGDGPLTVTSTAGAVWVAAYNGTTVRRIDARTAAVTATVTTPGSAPCGLVVADGRLWVFDQSDGSALAVDATTGRSPRRFRIGAQSGWAASGFGSLWVTDFQGASGDVLRLDPRTRRVTAHVAVGDQPIAAAAGHGSMWVTVTSTSTLVRIDPPSGRVTGRVRLPDGPTGLLVTRDAVWAMSFTGRAITRVDPRTGRATGSLALPGRAENAVLVGRDIWVTTADGLLLAVRPL